MSVSWGAWVLPQVLLLVAGREESGAANKIDLLSRWGLSPGHFGMFSRRASALSSRDTSRDSPSLELELTNRFGRLVYKVQNPPPGSSSQPGPGHSQPQLNAVPKPHPRISAIAAESSGGGHGPLTRRASSPTSVASFSGPAPGRAPVEIRQNRQNAQILRKNLAYSASASANLGSFYDYAAAAPPPTFLRRKSSLVSSSLRSAMSRLARVVSRRVL